jgi:flagellar hook assembly protein FlgD
VAEVVFEVLRPGEPRIAIASIVGRDAANRPVPVTRGLGSTHVVPQTTALAMSGPNPFHAGTAVALSLAHASRVEVELFSVDGRRVRRLMDGVQEPGVLRIQWDGRDDGGRGAGAGVYFLRVEAGRQRFTKRLVLLP